VPLGTAVSLLIEKWDLNPGFVRYRR
jgi:hypothetical protein